MKDAAHTPADAGCVVRRHGRWRLSADPVDQAEAFGWLDGVIEALCVVESSRSLGEAADRLRALEERYTDLHDGILPMLD